MSARGVSWGEVVETVTRAEISEPHDGKTRYHRGALCVVVAPDGTVVTVLLRSLIQWEDCDVRARRQTPDLRPGRPGVSGTGSKT